MEASISPDTIAFRRCRQKMLTLYSEIVNTTRALIIVLDAEGRIEIFNPACERVSGYRSDEVKGRPIWDVLLLPEEIAGVSAVFEELALLPPPVTARRKRCAAIAPPRSSTSRWTC